VPMTLHQSGPRRLDRWTDRVGAIAAIGRGFVGGGATGGLVGMDRGTTVESA
jgi:hypothetical protein